MMTTVITGASGHIGANLTRELLSMGKPVRAMVHVDHRALMDLDIEIVKGDLCNLESLYAAFQGAEVVYHLAVHISLSMDDWPLLEEINVIGTRNVIEACIHCGVRRLVYFSSIHALSQEPLDEPVDESRPLAGSGQCTPYDLSKAAGEIEVRKGIGRGLDAIIVNPTGVFGPHDYRPSFFGEALLALACRKMPALVDGGFDWVDVRDVVSGAIKAEETAAPGSKYILSGNWVFLPDLAALVEEITGASAYHLVCPMWLAPAGIPFVTAFARLSGRRPLYTRASLMALASNRNISHAKATRDLGYNPRPFRQTLEDTFRWFEENGYLRHSQIKEPRHLNE